MFICMQFALLWPLLFNLLIKVLVHVTGITVNEKI